MRFIRDGEKGGGEGVWWWREREIIYLSLHTRTHTGYTVTTRMTPALRWAAKRNRFNVSLIVRDKVTKRCPQTTTFEEKGEPKRIRTEVPLLTSLTIALPLGHTGSRVPAVAKILQFTSASPVPRHVVFGSLILFFPLSVQRSCRSCDGVTFLPDRRTHPSLASSGDQGDLCLTSCLLWSRALLYPSNVTIMMT